MVVSDWPQSMVAREIRACEELKLVGRWKPVFQCPVWFRTATFRGRSGFDVLVFRMRFWMLIGSLMFSVWLSDDGLSFLYLQFSW